MTETKIELPLLEFKAENPVGERKKLAEVLQIIEDELGEDKQCVIAKSLPIIPVKPKMPNRQNNYDLIVLLRSIVGRPIDPETNLPLNLASFRSQFEINFDLIAEIDEKLEKFGWSREELLEENHITPALYDYLIHFRFSRQENPNLRFNNLKQFVQTNPIFSYGFGIIISILILFPPALASYNQRSCLLNTKLDQGIYSEILNTFENKTELFYLRPSDGFSHSYVYLTGSFSPLCLEMTATSPSPIGLKECYSLPTHTQAIYFNPENPKSSGVIHVTACNATNINTNLIPIILTMSYYIGFTYWLMRELFDPCILRRNLPTKLMRAFLALSTFGIFIFGLDHLTNLIGLSDAFLYSFSKSARITCANACNDGLFIELIDDNVTQVARLPKALPTCDPNVNVVNDVLVSASFLATSSAFFGKKLIGFCRKKLNPNQGEREFLALEGRNFEYQS